MRKVEKKKGKRGRGEGTREKYKAEKGEQKK